MVGPSAHSSAGMDLHVALQKLTAESAVFEAAIGLGTRSDLRGQFGWLDPGSADLLDIEETTVLAVRPDGYIGLRCDRDHISALERYRTLVQAGH